MSTGTVFHRPQPKIRSEDSLKGTCVRNRKEFDDGAATTSRELDFMLLNEARTYPHAIATKQRRNENARVWNDDCTPRFQTYTVNRYCRNYISVGGTFRILSRFLPGQRKVSLVHLLVLPGNDFR